jgi:hypothetical protein
VVAVDEQLAGGGVVYEIQVLAAVGRRQQPQPGATLQPGRDIGGARLDHIDGSDNAVVANQFSFQVGAANIRPSGAAPTITRSSQLDAFTTNHSAVFTP